MATSLKEQLQQQYKQQQPQGDGGGSSLQEQLQAEFAKKKEPSATDSAPPSEGQTTPSAAGTFAASRYNSPFFSPSPDQSAVEALHQKQEEQDKLQKIANMARSQDAAGGLLSLSQPTTVDPIAGHMQAGRYEKILSGDAAEIARTLKAQRQQLAQRKAADLNSGYVDDTASPFATGAITAPDKSSDELDKLEKEFTDLKQVAAKHIDQQAAQKLLTLRGKELQEAAPEIGKQRRQQLADIGLDNTFEDEQGAAKYALKNKVAYGFMPGKVAINSDKYTQEADYLNERGVYDAAIEQQGKALDNMAKDQRVQLYLSGTDEQKKLLASDPTVADFLDRANRYDFLTNTAQNLHNKYPAVKYEIEKQRIADSWTDRIQKQSVAIDAKKGGKVIRQLAELLSGDYLDKDEEYRQISEDTGIPVDVVKAHAENDAPTGNIGVPSYLSRAGLAAVGVFNQAGQGLNRIALDKDKANVINRELEGINYQTPEAITKNWSADKVFDLMASGLGQFAGFVAGAEVAGAPIRAAGGLAKAGRVAEAIEKAADVGGTWASGYASSYEQAYQQAAQYTADEAKRHQYAQGDAMANGLSELVLRDIDVAKKILGRTPNTQLVDDFMRGKKSFTTGDVFKARLADFAKVLGYESAEELIPYFTDAINKNNIFGYKTSTSDLLNGAYDTIVQTMVSTIPMAVLSSGHVPTSELTHAALYEAGKNPEKYKAYFDQQHSDGKITTPELNRRNKLINTIADISSKLPSELQGKELDEKQKAQLAFNILKQRTLEDQKRTTDAAFHPAIDSELQAVKQQTDAIINQPIEAAATLAAKQSTEVAVENSQAQTPNALSEWGVGDEGILSTSNTTQHATSQSSKKLNKENAQGNSLESNLDANQRTESGNGLAQEVAQADHRNRPEASGPVQEKENQAQITPQPTTDVQKEEAQAQVVTLADRAQAARQGIEETTPTLQERLDVARQDAARRQERETQSQQRRQSLYTPQETEGEPAAQVMVAPNEAGGLVAATPEAAAEITPQENTAAPAADTKLIDGVYQFGAKQNVRIADINNSNDFRGPRRVSKEAVKYLRKNRGQQEVLLFRHPNGKVYVLDGKATIEAQRANRRATVPARFFNGTVEQAAEVAHLRKPLPPQSYLNQRASRVLVEQPRSFEEYALQVMLGIMRKVGNKPAFSLSDFVRYSGFGGTQQNRLRMNYGQTIGENDIKDLRSRGVISNNKNRRLINFDLFAKEWMDRPGNEGEDEGDLINQLTDLLTSYQSPEKIINRLEQSQGIEGAPLQESLLPFHVTPEESIYIAENDLYPTMQAILNNTDEIPDVTPGEQAAYEELVRSHTAGDGTLDINGIFNTLTTSDNGDLQTLRRKLATYATRQATQENKPDGNTGGKVVFERADGTLVESDDNGDFFSKWTGAAASDAGQPVNPRIAKRLANVFKKAFNGLQVSFDRDAFQKALQKATGARNSRESERAVYLHDQLQAASNELKTAQNAFAAKRQQLDRSVQQDQADLFGNRASAAPTNLFDERVDQSAREKAIKPYQDRVSKAKQRANELNKQLADEIKKNSGPSQAAMFSRAGAILGIATTDGKVFFNPDAVRLDTPMHEIGGHMLTAWAKANQPELYQKILSVAASAPDEVKQYVRDNYKEYAEDSPQFAEEVFATALGLDARNLERATELASANPQGFGRLRKAIEDIWKDLLNWLTDKGIIKGEQFDPAEFRDMSFADFANMVGEKIASGRRLSAPSNVAINSPNALLNQDDFIRDKWGNPVKVKAEVQAAIEAEKEQIKQEAIANGTYLLSPKGTATLLTPDQWAIVRTQRFKNWDNGTVLRSSDGEPQVFYHGTNTTINVFNPDQPVWFSPQRATANNYAALRATVGGTATTVPVFLRGTILDSFGGSEQDFETYLRLGDNPEALQAAGYDGLYDGTGVQMFNSGNVKSAAYNSTFSEETPDIRFQKQATLEQQFYDQYNKSDQSIKGKIQQFRTLIQLATEYGKEDKLLSTSPDFLSLFGSSFEALPEPVQKLVRGIESKTKAEQQAMLLAVDETLKTGSPSWQEVSRNYEVQKQALQNVPEATQVKPRIRIRVNANGVMEQVAVTPQEAKYEEKISSIKNATVAEKRRELNVFGATEKVKRTDLEVRQMADAAVAAGFDTQELIDDILNNKDQATDVEIELIGRYVATKENEVRKLEDQVQQAVQNGEGIETLKADRDRAIQQLNDAYNAARESGTETARALRYRRTQRLESDSLAAMFIRQSEVSGTSILTDAQVKQVTKEYEELKAANEALQKKLDKLAAEQSEKKAAAAFNGVRQSEKKQKKTHEEFVQERQSIVEHMRQQLRKARGEFSVTVVPYAKELVAIAPDVARFMRSLVQEGVVKLADVVENIHGIIKEQIPDVTRKDVHDIIAGEYNKPYASRNEIAERLYDLRYQAQLQNRLEKLLADEPTTERKRVARNRDIEDLRNKINDFRKEKRAAEAEAKKEAAAGQKRSPEEIALDRLKKRLQAQIEALENELHGVEKEKIEDKKPIVLDQEALDLKDKIIALKKEREQRLVQEEFDKKSKFQKGKAYALDLVNAPRTLMSSTDFSAPLRQGLVASVAHPVVASKAFGTMFTHAFNEKEFDRWFANLRESDDYQTMEAAGLYVADPHNQQIKAKEEAFMSNLIEKIPYLGTWLIKGSERAYVSYLNKLRVDLFRQGMANFKRVGMTMENRPELYKGLASLINNETGRGGMSEKLENSSAFLSSVFFSPRLIASRLNMLGISDITTAGNGFYSKLPPEIRKQAAGDMVKFVSFGLAILGLFKFGSKCTVEGDARSSDFGKIKCGDTRYDIWGGFQQYIKFFAQMISGQGKSTQTDKIYDLGTGKVFGKTRADVGLGFIRGKLAPIPSTAWNLLAGRDQMGDKVTIGSSLLNFLPLTAHDTYDAVKEEGVKGVLTTGLPATFGVGVATYSSKITTIDKLPNVGATKVEYLKQNGITDLEDLENTSNLSSLRAKNEEGKTVKIFTPKQAREIRKVLAEQKQKK